MKQKLQTYEIIDVIDEFDNGRRTRYHGLGIWRIKLKKELT
jgi:hypothetical protein